MSGGLLHGIAAIAAIRQEQDCSWDDAEKLWHISLDLKIEAALREQEYRDAIAEIEDNVIHYDFRLRTRLEK